MPELVVFTGQKNEQISIFKDMLNPNKTAVL